MAETGPPEASRPSGPRTPGTFLGVPRVEGPDGLDVIVVGIPTDGARERAGAALGPDAIRSASALLQPYNSLLGVDVAGRLGVGDQGDVDVSGASPAAAVGRAADALSSVAQAGARPLALGGDGTILLAGARAIAAAYGPVALVRLDAHHGMSAAEPENGPTPVTVVRRALEEGLLDPARSLVAGLRGTAVDAADAALPATLGVETMTFEELAALGPGGFAQRAHSRVGGAPCFVSFDVDFVDPAFAPGTARPVVGGPSSREALTLVRSLAGLDVRGMECVEVAPPLDPGETTALVAATACFELLSLAAVRYG